MIVRDETLVQPYSLPIQVVRKYQTLQLIILVVFDVVD